MHHLRRVRDLLLRLPWRELAGPLAITVPVVIYYRRLLTGAFPVSHDHPAHLFNAWLTSDVLLPRGQVTGFSDLWLAGYPAGDLDGPGASLWVSLFRYLTFGLLDYGTTYGLAVFGLLLLLPLSVYALGRTLFGRTAGFVAGLLMVMTKGGWYDIGWFWTLELGNWPFALGASFAFLGLAALHRYVSQGGAGRLAMAALAVAAASVSQPMSLVIVAFVAPALGLAHVLEHGRAVATRVLLRVSGALALSIGLSAAWLVPLFARSDYAAARGELWMDLDAAFPALAQLNLFGPEWRLVSGLALVGGLVAVARRRFVALALATSAAGMVLFATSDVLYDLRLFDVAGPLAGVQLPRLMGAVRVLSYLLAGYAIRELAGVATAQAGAAVTGTKRSIARFAVAAGLPLALCLPAAPQLAGTFREGYVPKAESLVTQRDLGWWPHFLDAAAWLREHAEGEPWSRVGAFGSSWDDVVTMLPVWSGLPVYTGAHVPGHSYRFDFDGHADKKTLRAVGVRYVVARGEWGKHRPEATLQATFGPFRIYELEGKAPRRVSAVGRCQVEEVAIDDGQMVADVSGAAGPCRLRFHRGDHPSWRAAFEGEPLDVERIGTYRGSRYAAFMSVVVPGDGRVTLTWERPVADMVGLALTASGALVLLLLGVAAWRPRWFAAVPRVGPRWRPLGERILWPAVGALALAVVVVAVLRTREARFTFDRHLDDAERFVERDGDRIDCRRGDWGKGWQCSEPWDEIRSGAYSFINDNRYCIFDHPSPYGKKHLLFRDVPLGTRLSGFYGLIDSAQGMSPVTLEVRVGDGLPVAFSVNDVGRVHGFDLPTEPGSADVDVTVSAPKPEWRQLCFNMQVE